MKPTTEHIYADTMKRRELERKNRELVKRDLDQQVQNFIKQGGKIRNFGGDGK